LLIKCVIFEYMRRVI